MSKKNKKKNKKAKVKVLNVTKLTPKSEVVTLLVKDAPEPAPEVGTPTAVWNWLKSIW